MTGRPSRSAASAGIDWSCWTVILLKPDCLARGLTGAVLDMVGETVEVLDRQIVYPTIAQIFEHYADILPLSEQLGVDVIAELGRIYIGRPVLVAIGYGPDAALRLRAALGPRDPADGGLATIRGRFGADSLPRARAQGRLTDNVIHASDNATVVPDDLARWFGPGAVRLLRPPLQTGAAR